MPTIREMITSWGFDIDTAKLDRLDKDLGQLSKKANDTGKNFKQFSKDVTATGARLTAFVTLPILAAGAGLLKAASDAEETRSKFTAVFKELASGTREWVADTAKAVGRSKIDLEGYLATLQDTFVPLGFARSEAAELSKTLTLLAIDLASFNNESEPETIRSLQSAIVGNTETVRKYGVIITQATLDQELLNNGVAGGVKKATEAQKAQARLNIIMKSTTDAQGDAKRTALEFANQMRALKSEAADVAADFGALLIPSAQKVVTVLRSGVEWFSNLTGGTQKTILIVAGFVAVIGPLIFILGTLGVSIVYIVQAFTLLKGALVLVRGYMVAFNIAALFIPILFAAIGIALALLAEDLYSFFTGQKSLIGEWLGSWEDVLKVLPKMWDEIKVKAENFWQDLKDVFSSPITSLANAFGFGDANVEERKKAKSRLPTTFKPKRFIEAETVANLANKVNAANSLTAPGSLAGNIKTITNNSSTNKVANQTISMSVETNVTVPAGTSDEQAVSIADSAKEAVKTELDKMLRQTAANSGGV